MRRRLEQDGHANGSQHQQRVATSSDGGFKPLVGSSFVELCSLIFSTAVSSMAVRGVHIA